jgi:hypothetical protein
LLSDTFADGNRTNQSLPDSAAWYSGGLSGDASAASFQLLASNIAGSNRGFIAYFTASGSPVTLDVGQSMVLSAQVQTIGAAGGDARFQFWAFNSGGSRIAVDNSAFNNAIFNGYTGYGVTNDPVGVHPARYQIRERVSGANNLLIGANTPLLGGSAQSINMTANLTAVSLTLHRTGVSEMTITGSIGGTPIVRTDTTGIFTSFDSIGILTSNDTLTGNLVIDNVTVIPEPGTFALLAVSALSLLLVFRRKHG